MSSEQDKIEIETHYMINTSINKGGEVTKTVTSYEMFKQPTYSEPKMLIVEELIKDLTANICEIDKYKNQLDNENFKCNFIYIYSLFEGALWQMTNSILFAFPEIMISFLDVEKNQKELIRSNFDKKKYISNMTNEKLKKIGKENLVDFFVSVEKIINVNVDLNKELLREISECRNSIVHNNTLKPHNEFNREDLPKHNYYCKSDIEKFSQELLGVLEEVKVKTMKKYAKYTYLKLLKDAWNYTVGGYMGFDSLIGFEHSSWDNRTTVAPNFENIKIAFSGFSSTEKAMLTIWMQQHGANIVYDLIKENRAFKPWAFLDREKLIFLVNLFDKFPHLMDGHDYSNDIKENKING